MLLKELTDIQKQILSDLIQMKAPDTRPYCHSPNHNMGIPTDSVISKGKNSTNTKIDSTLLMISFISIETFLNL